MTGQTLCIMCIMEAACEFADKYISSSNNCLIINSNTDISMNH